MFKSLIHVSIKSNNIEVQQLSQAMNEMLDKIQQDYQKLSQFSEDIAHELRTPLNNLMGQTQILLSQSRPVEELENLLYSHLEEYERLTKMIESMLFIARSEHAEYGLEKQALNVKQLIETIADYFDCVIEERQMRLVFDLPDDLSIVANAALMQRAIANLISNAVLHGKEQGTIALQAYQSDQHVGIIVQTEGVFIEEKHLPHLFDRFYQVDQSRHQKARTGGLGLAIVKSIMQQHDGIAAVANHHNGIAFKLILPLKN